MTGPPSTPRSCARRCDKRLTAHPEKSKWSDFRRRWPARPTRDCRPVADHPVLLRSQPSPAPRPSLLDVSVSTLFGICLEGRVASVGILDAKRRRPNVVSSPHTASTKPAVQIGFSSVDPSGSRKLQLVNNDRFRGRQPGRGPRAIRLDPRPTDTLPRPAFHKPPTTIRTYAMRQHRAPSPMSAAAFGCHSTHEKAPVMAIFRRFEPATRRLKSNPRVTSDSLRRQHRNSSDQHKQKLAQRYLRPNGDNDLINAEHEFQDTRS